MNSLYDLVKQEGGGSGFGISHYGNKCPRAARLNKEFPSPSGFEAKCGTVFHKLMELYYTGELNKMPLPMEDMPNEEDPVQEALRIFAVYRQYFAPSEWDTLHAEYKLPLDNDPGCAGRIGGVVGIEPFTARIDLVAKFSAQQAADFSRKNARDVSPGIYIVDHKLRFKRDSHALLKWGLNIQLVAYVMAYEAATGEKVQGYIINQPIAHKRLQRDSFERFVYPAPDDTARRAIRDYLMWKKDLLESDVCNLEVCGEFRGCHHYLTGRCNRV